MAVTGPASHRSPVAQPERSSVVPAGAPLIVGTGPQGGEQGTDIALIEAAGGCGIEFVHQRPAIDRGNVADIGAVDLK